MPVISDNDLHSALLLPTINIITEDCCYVDCANQPPAEFFLIKERCYLGEFLLYLSKANLPGITLVLKACEGKGDQLGAFSKSGEQRYVLHAVSLLRAYHLQSAIQYYISLTTPLVQYSNEYH